jgi:hypothetical protein
MKKHALQRGQTLPLIAVAAILLGAAAGFAADVGYHQYQQRVQQTATDSAALAAAAELSAGNWVQAGQRDATSNGFTAGAGPTTSVNIAHPTAPDPYASDSHAVEADITATYATFFEKLFGIGSVDVTTKAVAISDATSNLCMVALNTSGTSNIDAHSVINAPTCSIAINNSNLSIGGQSTITTQVPIQYSGRLTGSGTSTFSPSAPVQALPISDPCSQIPSCNYLQQNPPSTSGCVPFTWSASVTPGVQPYCSMTFGGNTQLEPGLYVVTGNFIANNVTLSGSGVTIVDMSSNCPNVNNATMALTAPASGDYAGMLWYDPSCNSPVTMNSGTGGLDGVLYFPKANLTMNASGPTAQVEIISGQITLNSSNTTFSAPSAGQITYPRLVE